MQAKEGFVRSGGFHGIYKGIGAVVLGSVPGGSFIFAIMRLMTP
jgi:solute carrier family 25 (mitochondrial S-adenosylmethionine transporter), member 26